MATYQGDIFGNNKVGDSTLRDEMFGSWGDDKLWGSGGNDLLDGQEDNDMLFGGTGNDTLIGGSGDDELSGGDHNDTMSGGANDDTLKGGDGNDTMSGGQGDDILEGEAGDDTIDATLGVDRVSGGSGNDTIDVDGGDGWRFDRVDGGSGNDVIRATGIKVLVSGGSGDDFIRADAAKETVLIGGAGNDRFVITQLVTPSGVAAEIHGGDASVTFGTNWNPAAMINVGAEITTVTPGSDTGIDTLDLSALTGMTVSQTNPDLGNVHRAVVNLATGQLAHTIGPVGFGGAAYDDSEVETLEVARISGIDNVIGSSGADFLQGNTADNDLSGGGGEDIINGGAGADDIEGGAENDTLSGGTGNDTLAGGSGDDTMSGNENDDRLDGGAGNDTINGGSGADTLIGGLGFDILDGGANADTIYGNYFGETVNADRLTGGTGADKFVFTDVAKTGIAVTVVNPATGATGVMFLQQSIADSIIDFTVAGTSRDVIDFATLLDNRSNFTGTTAQQAITQGYIYFSQVNSPAQGLYGTNVMFDANGGAHGDAANNFTVAFLNMVDATTLGATHFLV